MKMHEQDGIIHFWLVGLIAENNIPNTYLETAIFSVNSLDSPATGLFFNYWKHAYQREDATWWHLTSTELLDAFDYLRSEKTVQGVLLFFAIDIV